MVNLKNTDIKNKRSFVLLGHTQSGKTTLTDAILKETGLASEDNQVANGTSVADYTKEEINRKISIYAKPFTCIYKSKNAGDQKMVFIDSPGYDDFIGQVLSAYRAADTGVIVVDAAGGIQLGAKRAWDRCAEYQKPCAIAVTGLDKENVDFGKILKQLQNDWSKKCVPVSLSSTKNEKYINILDVDAGTLSADEELAGYKESLVEAAAESNDELLEKYLGGEELTAAEVSASLTTAVAQRNLFPVFAVSPLKSGGIKEMLEAIITFFPSPAEVPVKTADGTDIDTSLDASFIGQVWRTVTDPYAGKLVSVRVLSGTLSENSTVYNLSKAEKEKITTLLISNGNNKTDSVSTATAGDIVELPKLKNTEITDILSSESGKVELPVIKYPNPVTFYAVSAKERGDEDKISMALSQITDDDPTLNIERHNDTNEMVISGMGDTQIEVAHELIDRGSNVETLFTTPKVSYRETITAEAKGHYRHKKQSGGRGQFAEVFAQVQPKQEDEEWFENAIVGGVIPRNFIPSCEKGIQEAMKKGVLAGFPVVNVKVTIYDGSFHEVDSSDIAFKIAASRAFNDAMQKAKPVLLEPIMNVRVSVPEEYMGDVNGDLNQKRGRILGVEIEEGRQVIKADVPLAEMFRYLSELRSLTGGQGAFQMSYSRYEPVPANIAEKVKERIQKESEEN
jgi:elongation factor G